MTIDTTGTIRNYGEMTYGFDAHGHLKYQSQPVPGQCFKDPNDNVLVLLNPPFDEQSGFARVRYTDTRKNQDVHYANPDYLRWLPCCNYGIEAANERIRAAIAKVEGR